MSATVHIDELIPETRARVLEQISGTDGGTTALATVVTNSDEPQLLPASMADEPLAEIVVSGCRKFRTLIPYVIELRKRFNSKIRGNADIAGCKTWTEFCEKHLDRTTSAVQRAIAVHANPESREPKHCLPPAPKPAPISNREAARQRYKQSHPESITDSNHDVDEKIRLEFVQRSETTPATQCINSTNPPPTEQPIIDAEFVDASQPIENPDADIEGAILALPKSPELDEAVKNPSQHNPINNQPTKPEAETESFLKQTQRVWKSVTNPSVGRIKVIASNVGSDVETAAGRYDLLLYGVTPQLLNKIRELLSCK